MSDQSEIDAVTIALTKALADEGKLIEAGWVSLRHVTMPPDAPQEQLDDLRMAFFAGAQHLFGSIMNILDAGEEATDADQARMSAINDELNTFIASLGSGLPQ